MKTRPWNIKHINLSTTHRQHNWKYQLYTHHSYPKGRLHSRIHANKVMPLLMERVDVLMKRVMVVVVVVMMGVMVINTALLAEGRAFIYQAV
jgi:hypothetical protein